MAFLSVILPRSTLLINTFAIIIDMWKVFVNYEIYLFFPQHFLYFFPLPHGHGSFG